MFKKAKEINDGKMIKGSTLSVVDIIPCDHSFKGSVRGKMKEGIGLRRKIIDGDRYKSYFLSVASITRTLFKTALIEERSVHTNSESCNSRL